jgi:hypothetical protein
MKKLFFLLISYLSSFITYSQSGTMLPDGFIIPKSATAPTCTVSEVGKIYLNTTTNDLMLCDGTNWKNASSQWRTPFGLTNVLTYNGLVGINNTNPAYELDVTGSARVSGTLYVPTTLGIGTTNPSTGLDVLDGDIAISSTADAKTWKFDYDDALNALTLKENGVNRMMFANGGNVGIGSVAPTAKLSVDGTGSFAGDLTVNNGKGIVRSTGTAALKCHIVQANLGITFAVNAGFCATSNVNITSGGFTAAPTAQIGNLVSGTGDFGKLNINVQSTTSTAAIVRFCNNTASNITLSNMIFNLMCLGQ